MIQGQRAVNPPQLLLKPDFTKGGFPYHAFTDTNPKRTKNNRASCVGSIPICAYPVCTLPTHLIDKYMITHPLLHNLVRGLLHLDPVCRMTLVAAEQHAYFHLESLR
jgi:hypothetical protein